MTGRAVRKRIRWLEYNGLWGANNNNKKEHEYYTQLRAGSVYTTCVYFYYYFSADISIARGSIESTSGRSHSHVASFILKGQNRCLSTHFTFCRTLPPSFCVAVYIAYYTAHYVHVYILTKLYILLSYPKEYKSLWLYLFVCIYKGENWKLAAAAGQVKKGDERDKNTREERGVASP